MNWEAIGSIGEFLGGSAVVVSLIYLATQIREQNRESKIATVHEIASAFRHAITSFQDPQRAEIYIKAIDGFDTLNDAQRLQFISIIQGLLRVWEEAYYLRLENRLDERLWNGMLTQYMDLMAMGGMQRVWELRKHAYSSEFRAFVDSLEVGEYRLK